MLRVLIADDEQLICSMINKMIDWEGRGLTLAGMANNGLDVLAQIRELHPDIVITDIRMPGLTGLELIEEAMKIDDSLDFIIISGYKNFDYAHQALTMGVRHYLLKPIDRTELMDTLDRIIEARRKTEANRSGDEALAVQQESYRQEARQHFLNSILQDSGMESTESTVKDPGNEEERLAFRKEGYRAFFVKLDSTEEGEAAPGLLEILRTLVEKEETDHWHCEHITTLVKSGIISMINTSVGARQEHPKDMETLFTKCRREADKFTGYSVTIGVGAEKYRIQDTRISIDEATCAVKYRIRAGLSRVIHYEDLKHVDDDISSVFTQNHRNGSRRAVEALVIHFILSKTCFGRFIYAVGGSPETARLAGINVSKIKLMTFALAGVLFGISAIILTSRGGSASSNIGPGVEFDAITACVLGGVSFIGGAGRVADAVVGCLILGVLTNGMQMIGLDVNSQYVVKGIILMASIGYDTYQQQAKVKKAAKKA